MLHVAHSTRSIKSRKRVSSVFHRQQCVRLLTPPETTARGDAEPPSDLDLVIVFAGTPEQRHDLSLWLEGWSLCLAEVAARQGGWNVEGGLLDVTWRDAVPRAAEMVRLRRLRLSGG